LVCAKAAGKVAAAAALEGDSSKKRLGECDRLWRARIGQELAVGMRLNNLLTSLTLKELDEIFAYLSRKPELLRLVEEHGDIDRPSILALKMLPHVGIDGLKLANLLRNTFF
jgi:flavin-dependent dehydrogenase